MTSARQLGQISYRDITRFYYVKASTELRLWLQRGTGTRSARVVQWMLPRVQALLHMTSTAPGGKHRH